MAKTFYFYDLETSGVNPRIARIMQFAGQRTNLNLKAIGKPDNILIKLSPDVLPEPDAVLTHGISPQRAIAEGMSEADFLAYFTKVVCIPGTILTGFNNVRFDDEFMRFTLWRNFYDAYEWHWKDECSRWDLLDVVRLTRALRPEGIEWPFDTEGKPTNRLEFLTTVNKLDHETAHDAESDVKAVIAMARLVKNKQPRLFDYLLTLRDKNKVAALVGKGEPFVYASGRYASEFEKTTVVAPLAMHLQGRGSFVYDLRTDPAKYVGMTSAELAELWRYRPRKTQEEQSKEHFPVKLLSYNRCPAVAPLSVLDADSLNRLRINMTAIEQNAAALEKAKHFSHNILEAYDMLQPADQPKLVIDEQMVDGQLYDGFVNQADKNKMSVVRATEAEELADLDLEFDDERLKILLPLYKARNYPQLLSSDEQSWWEEFRTHRLLDGGEHSQAARFFKRLEAISTRKSLSAAQRYLLEELNLYGQSILPVMA